MTTKTIAKSSTSKSHSATSSGDGLQGGFQAILAEARKVTWPTLPQIWANTLVVLTMTLLFSSLLWLIDNVFRGIITFLTQDLVRLIGA